MREKAWLREKSGSVVFAGAPALRDSYVAHLGAPVAHMLLKGHHSSLAIQAEDILMLSEETERLRRYVPFNNSAFKMFMQIIGQHFENSPSERKTEVPLMILTGTETVFYQRIRRLKRLQKDDHSSHSASGSEISFSKSYMPNSRCEYLESHLSQKSLSDLSQFKEGSQEMSSFFEIYASENMENSEINIYNQTELIESAARPTINSRTSFLPDAAHSRTEEGLRHLILTESSEANPEQRDQQGRCRLGWQSAVGPLDEILARDLPLQIKKEVYRSLCRYNWSLRSKGPSSCHEPKKMLRKAEQLLHSINR